jgi:hypothetical protein
MASVRQPGRLPRPIDRYNIKLAVNGVPGRTFISAFLISTLLPISSFAAICDLNCRGAAPMMAMSSQGLGHAAHDKTSGAQHHRHLSTETGHSMPDADVTSASGHHQVSDSHQCCDATRLSNPCAMPRQNEPQEQTATPRFGDDPAVVQAQVHVLAVIIEGVSPALAAEKLAPSPPAHSLTLRI